MATLDATNGFHIHGWMVTELHLEGADLFTFALVHQFAQGGAGKYIGNTAYLAEWTGWSEKTCRTHLQNLVNMGLIEAVRGREDNTPFCYYKLAKNFYEKHPEISSVSPGKNYQKHPVKITASPGKNYRQEYNIEENIIDSIKENSKRKSEFVAPSVGMVEAYARERGFRDPSGFAKHFVDYYTIGNWCQSNGKKLKDWKRAVITWEPGSKDRVFTKTSPQPVERRTKSNNPLDFDFSDCY